MTVNSLYGEQTVIKKVMTQNAQFGDIISDYIRSADDLLDCPKAIPPKIRVKILG